MCDILMSSLNESTVRQYSSSIIEVLIIDAIDTTVFENLMKRCHAQQTKKLLDLEEYLDQNSKASDLNIHVIEDSNEKIDCYPIDCSDSEDSDNNDDFDEDSDGEIDDKIAEEEEKDKNANLHAEKKRKLTDVNLFQVLFHIISKKERKDMLSAVPVRTFYHSNSKFAKLNTGQFDKSSRWSGQCFSLRAIADTAMFVYEKGLNTSRYRYNNAFASVKSNVGIVCKLPSIGYRKFLQYVCPCMLDVPQRCCANDK